MSLKFIFCLHTLRKVTHFLLTNSQIFMAFILSVHTLTEMNNFVQAILVDSCENVSVKMTVVTLTERVAFEIFAWRHVAAWQNQYLHETKLVSHHFSRIVYQQTADKQTSLKTLTPQTASLFLFTDFTDILLNVNVALIDVVSLVVNVLNKNNNNLLTNAAKCQIVSPVLWRVLL